MKKNIIIFAIILTLECVSYAKKTMEAPPAPPAEIVLTADQKAAKAAELEVEAYENALDLACNTLKGAPKKHAAHIPNCLEFIRACSTALYDTSVEKNWDLGDKTTVTMLLWDAQTRMKWCGK